MNTLTESIQTIADQIQQVPTDLGSQVQYLETLCDLKWSIGELMPQANILYNERLATVSQEVIEQYKDSKIGMSVLNGLIKGKLAQEQKLVDICNRINSTITLHSQNLRTIISFKKVS